MLTVENLCPVVLKRNLRGPNLEVESTYLINPVGLVFFIIQKKRVYMGQELFYN